jgi:LPS-assembly lipoprotein
MRKLLILTLLLLTSCGFHLRGSVKLPPEMSELAIHDAEPATDIAPDLRDTLLSQGVKIVDTAPVIIHLRNESYSKRVLSVDKSGNAQEYELGYTIRVKVQGADGVVWMPEEVISLQRDLRFDNSAVLGTSDEETQLQEDMRRDAISQILEMLRYVKPPVKGKAK